MLVVLYCTPCMCVCVCVRVHVVCYLGVYCGVCVHIM